MGFLNDQKLLYKEQFGFQKKFCTAYAVISLIENIEKAIDNKNFCLWSQQMICKMHLIM